MSGYRLFAVASVFVAREIKLGESFRSSPGTIAFNSYKIFSHLNFEESQVTPVLSPGVSDDPILFLEGFIESPSNNTDNVVNALIS